MATSPASARGRARRSRSSTRSNGHRARLPSRRPRRSVSAANSSRCSATMPTRRRKAVRRCSRRWKPSSEPQNPFVLSLSKDRSSHPTGQEKISPSTSSGRTELIMADSRSEEQTSELQSLMRISYAVFCLKKNKEHNDTYVYRTDFVYDTTTKIEGLLQL